MTQEKWNTYLHTWKSKIFTARNAKIAVTAIVICTVAGSGGAWYHHQQKQAYKEKKIQAISQMIEAQAQNLTLIPEEKARALAAQAIGKDESSLSFSRISLIDLEGSKHEKGEDRHKEKDKKDKKYRDKKQDREKDRTPAPGTARPDDTAGATGKGTAPDTRPAPDGQPAATAPAAPATPAATAFHPVYQIRASDGDIHYHILIDAVSGDILASRIA